MKTYWLNCLWQTSSCQNFSARLAQVWMFIILLLLTRCCIRTYSTFVITTETCLNSVLILLSSATNWAKLEYVLLFIFCFLLGYWQWQLISIPFQVEELKPDGANIPVTSLNRIEYIHLVADYKLNKQIRLQCNAFRQVSSISLLMLIIYLFFFF